MNDKLTFTRELLADLHVMQTTHDIGHQAIAFCSCQTATLYRAVKAVAKEREKNNE